MIGHLAAAQDRARQAQDQLAETTVAHAAELERVRDDARDRLEAAIADADARVEQARQQAQETTARGRTIAPSRRRSAQPS